MPLSDSRKLSAIFPLTSYLYSVFGELASHSGLHVFSSCSGDYILCDKRAQYVFQFTNFKTVSRPHFESFNGPINISHFICSYVQILFVKVSQSIIAIDLLSWRPRHIKGSLVFQTPLSPSSWEVMFVFEVSEGVPGSLGYRNVPTEWFYLRFCQLAQDARWSRTRYRLISQLETPDPWVTIN